MKAPQEGPLGVQLLAHEDGAFLTVEEAAPFWQFWKMTRRCTVFLNKFGMIWLYQGVAKLMRRGVADREFDAVHEFQWDLQSAMASQEANIANRVAMNDEVLRNVAQLMCAKGWVKM